MATVAGSRSLLFAVMFAVTVAADDGDDFANNLFSDLAPLLALFGERVTMQFMSQSLGWADNVILAMVPLGIITIITSAIRVGGPTFLKALIGRARENLAIAEQELMSSTSREVFMRFDEVEERYLKKEEKSWIDIWKRVHNNDIEKLPTPTPPSNIIVTRNPDIDAPNISLNSHNRMSRAELRTVAVLGVILQLVVLTFSACAVYFSPLEVRFQKDGNPVAGYAFPCNAVGTLLLVAGMLLCAHVVESSTGEKVFRPSSNLKAQLVWLQQKKTVNDQVFESFAIYAKTKRASITTSQRWSEDKTTHAGKVKQSGQGSDQSTTQPPASIAASSPDVTPLSENSEQSDHHGAFSPEGDVLELKTILGTIISLCGFIVQFVGLRGLHWSASIIQLGAVLLMTGLRAWVRRGLSEPPHCQHILSGFELDWFATTFANAQKAPWWPDDKTDDKTEENKRWTLDRLEALGTGFSYSDELSPSNAAHRVIKIRRDLAQLAAWHGPVSAEAISIARSIEATMDVFFQEPKRLNYTWALKTPTNDQVHFRLHYKNGRWQAYADELEAALSLWLFSTDKDENDDGTDGPDKVSIGDTQDDKWLRAKGYTAKNSLRVLGSYSRRLHRDLSWWIPHETTKIISLTKVKDTAEQTGVVDVRNHRIVGSMKSPPCPDTPTAYRTKEVPEFCFDTNDPEDSKDGEHNDRILIVNQIQVDCNQDLLAVEFNGSLKSLFAHDIFSSFLTAATKTLQTQKRSPFTEPAEIQPSDNTSSQAWQSFTLRSDQLMKLARAVQSTGLGSLDDIYLSMIPSLSAENKLPQVTRVIDLTRQHAEPHEEIQRWQEASHAYLWLFRVAKTYPEDSEFVTQAVAILVEFLRQINSALDLCERLNDEHWEALRPLEEMIKSELRNGGKIEETYDRLVDLYAAQQRPWKGAVISQETGDKFPVTFNLTQMHSKVMNERAHLHPYDIEKAKRNLNTKDVLGWTPLHYMARREIAIDFPFSTVRNELAVNSQDLLGHTALHYACDMKHEDQTTDSSIHTLLQNIQTLMQWGAEINTKGRDGVAPIHCAAKSGNLQAMRFLVDSGANINIQDASGKTPLLWSVVGGNQATVEYLWENANTKLRDGEGRTALHLAVVFADDETVAWLLEHGADARAVDRRARTPLHQIGQSGRMLPEAMQLLCQNDPADANAKDGHDQTPLHSAASNGHEAVVRWLVEEARADVEAKDSHDQTPLHLAACNGHEAVMKCLFEETGADLNAKDYIGRTALHLAVENGHEAVVKWLTKEARADLNARDHNGWAALHLAVQNGHEAFVKWLTKEARADVNAKDSFRRTALHFAVIKGHEAMVEWLITAGAEVNAKNRDGQTALHFAARNGHEAVVKWLIKAGADTNARDGNEQTLLHWATENGYEAVVKLLIQAGADASTVV